MSFHVGQQVDLTVTFRNAAGALADPTEVVLQVKAPSATNATAYMYSLAQVTRSSLGVFTYRLTLSEADVWTYRYVGTGAVNASTGDETIPVDPTIFPPP